MSESIRILVGLSTQRPKRILFLLLGGFLGHHSVSNTINTPLETSPQPSGTRNDKSSVGISFFYFLSLFSLVGFDF